MLSLLCCYIAPIYYFFAIEIIILEAIITSTSRPEEKKDLRMAFSFSIHCCSQEKRGIENGYPWPSRYFIFLHFSQCPRTLFAIAVLFAD